MSCPGREELEGLFGPGAAPDPARATAVLAHVRECQRCRELLASEPARALAAPEPTRRRRPNLALVALAAAGVALVVVSRSCAARRPAAGVAPVATRP